MPVELTKQSIDLGLITTNGEAMVAFYRDVLGLEQEAVMPMPGGGQMTRIKIGTTILKIVVNLPKLLASSFSLISSC